MRHIEEELNVEAGDFPMMATTPLRYPASPAKTIVGPCVRRKLLKLISPGDALTDSLSRSPPAITLNGKGTANFL